MNSTFGQIGQAFRAVWVSNTGSIANAVTSDKLASEQIGVFPADDYSGAGGYVASTTTPSFRKNKRFVLKQGITAFSGQNTPSSSRQDTKPRASIEFESGDIVSWKGSKGSLGSNTQIIYIGYDGLDASKSLTAKLDAKPVVIKVVLEGEPIKRFFGRNRIIRSYTIDKSLCVGDCDCFDACGKISCDTIADGLIKAIKMDKFNGVEIGKFFKLSKIKNCTVTGTAPTLTETTTWQVDVFDDGNSLGFVGAQYPNKVVSQVGRTGAITSYQLKQLTGAGTPTAFSATNATALVSCGACAAAYTLVGATDNYIVRRPLAGTEDLVGGISAYVATVKAAYLAKTFAGTGVNTSTEAITVTGHGFVVNAPVVYSNGGGTSITGLTSGNTYYVKTVIDANNITVSATKGGTVVDITAAGVGSSHTFTLVGTAALASQTVAEATIQLSVPSGVVLTQLLSDTLVSAGTTAASCTPPSGATYSWYAVGTCNTITQDYMVVVPDTLCGTDQLAAIQAAYPSLTVSADKTGTCMHSYRTTIASDCIAPELCGASTLYTFTNPPTSFMGYQWVVYNDVPLTASCVVTAPVAPPCCVCGIKLETAVWNEVYTECTYGWFDWHPNNAKPVIAYISAHSMDYTNNLCTETNAYVYEAQKLVFNHGSTGRVVQEYERSFLAYEKKFWRANPFANQLQGFQLHAKVGTLYDTYELRLKARMHDTTYILENQDSIVYMFYVPTGAGKSIESTINGLVLSTGRAFTPVVL